MTADADAMTCGEKFSGTVMAPIPYPAVGWEPVQESDECEREKGHDGKHRGKRIEWAAPEEPT